VKPNATTPRKAWSSSKILVAWISVFIFIYFILTSEMLSPPRYHSGPKYPVKKIKKSRLKVWWHSATLIVYLIPFLHT
jgi:hypothetical protein